jgi:hypothetical protein
MVDQVNTGTGATNTFQMLADEFGQLCPEQQTTGPEVAIGAATEAAASAGTESSPTSEADLRSLYLRFHNSGYPRTALCLSGGGIRSAAFALGVIQCLAKSGLLPRFDYLSTVSGGGYIGSWLSAWFTRVVDPQGKGGYGKIRDELARRKFPEHEAPEIDALRANSNYLTPKVGALSADTWSALAIWLRNLLVNWFLLVPLICAAAVAPQIISSLTGAAQQSHWAMWVQIIGICCYAVSLICFSGGRPRLQAFSLTQPTFLWGCLSVLMASAVLWAVSMAYKAKLPDLWRSFVPAQIGGFPDPIPDYVFLAAVLYTIAILVATAWNLVWSPAYVFIQRGPGARNFPEYSFARTRAAGSDANVWVYAEDRQAVAGQHYEATPTNIIFDPGKRVSAQTFKVKLKNRMIGDRAIQDGDFFVKFRNPEGVRLGVPSVWKSFLDAAAFIFSGMCFGLFLGAGDYVFRAWFVGTQPVHMTVGHHLLLSTLAVPWLLLSHAFATVIFVALTSWLRRSDEEREWIGRAAGWILVVAVAWLLIAALVLLIPYAVDELLQRFEITPDSINAKNLSAAVAVLGAVSGVLTAIVGGGPKTAAIPGQPQTFWRNFALYVGAPVFLASLLVGLGLAVDWLAFGKIFGREIALTVPAEAVTKKSGDVWTKAPSDFMATACTLCKYGILPAFASILIGRFINLNRFSLHEMYRNRLVRAFLGASNRDESQRDRFTFFNFTDNLPVSRLWMRRDGNKGQQATAAAETDKPIDNRRSSEDDWRPFHVINIALNLVDTDKPAWQERKAESFTVTPLWSGSAQLDAFRRTSEYGGKNDTLTLGTAMAISGAAVSPNMGYNSSPLITFLLTLFNVRLGWWLGNPKYRRFADEGPRWAAGPLLFELFGLTNDKRDYVYLSDGGHFENLGLYEMVRRRCHLIIVSDAGQDPELAFADLANAVRKIWIDLGVRIVFPKLDELRVRNKNRKKPGKGGPCYTVGRILYSAADDVSKGLDGYILYLKPGFRGDESADIIGYAAGSTDFPHETTVDQWFSESQFESYRGLGFSIMERAHDTALENCNNGKPKDKQIKDFRASTTLEFFESLSMVEKVDANSTYIGAAGPPSS